MTYIVSNGALNSTHSLTHAANLATSSKPSAKKNTKMGLEPQSNCFGFENSENLLDWASSGICVEL